MQLVILAAGEGTRMRPLTDSVPKPMVPLLGKPKLEYTLDLLPEEIDEIIFVINYLGNQIKEHFSDSYKGKKIRYVFQTELNGTGGALYACKDLLGKDFMVMNGDDLYHKDDISKMMRHDLALLALEVQDPSQYGILLTNDSGHLLGIQEKPHDNQTNLVNTGLYKLIDKIFDYPLVPISEKEFGLPQTLVTMVNDYPIVIERAKIWKPLGRIEDIAIAEQSLNEFMRS